jgi:hypothetical protein
LLEPGVPKSINEKSKRKFKIWAGAFLKAFLRVLSIKLLNRGDASMTYNIPSKKTSQIF